MSEQLRGTGGEYEIARCVIPLGDGTVCSQELTIITTLMRPVYLADTAEDLRDTDADASWRVECERGHVVCLPPDDGEPFHYFGVSREEGDDGRPLPSPDMACLRAVTLPAEAG